MRTAVTQPSMPGEADRGTHRLDTILDQSWADAIASMRGEIAAVSCDCLLTGSGTPVLPSSPDEPFTTDEVASRHLVALGRLDQALVQVEQAWDAVRRTVEPAPRELGPYGRPAVRPIPGTRTTRSTPPRARTGR
ncbi:hypothetical protein GCM10007298_08570 [Williamsia phyllosphaerae]|uniref:Uncharacterized protein n=1 Tax=Williamsia phyllosphaerae TaxID=885042 RepID=A0ABQ1UEA0_9NOCA|nr:hypothetical protein GCM10007298_08570 [Williamsia phyllosphaerae]